jgi:hypothetical protein
MRPLIRGTTPKPTHGLRIAFIPEVLDVVVVVASFGLHREPVSNPPTMSAV